MLCVFALPVFATSMALMMTEHELVVAMDSRVSDGNGQQLPDVCKIRRAGNTYFSITGYAGRQTGLFESFRQAMEKTGSLVENLKEEAARITPVLEAEVRDDAGVQEYVRKYGRLTDVTVYGIKDNRPFVKYLVFLPDGHAVKYDLKQCPGDNCPRNGDPLMVTAPIGSLNTKGEPREATQAYVLEHIAMNVPEFGGPIQVLRLVPNAAPEWIEKPPICSDQ